MRVRFHVEEPDPLQGQPWMARWFTLERVPEVGEMVVVRACDAMTRKEDTEVAPGREVATKAGSIVAAGSVTRVERTRRGNAEVWLG